MSFGEEVTQLLVIIVVLLVAYLGINVWTKKGGRINLGGSAGGTGGADGVGDSMGGAGGVGGVGGVGGAEAEDDFADIPRSGNAAERHGDRFNLTGRDAEAAAKVLKRMLQQDEEFKNRQG